MKTEIESRKKNDRESHCLDAARGGRCHLRQAHAGCPLVMLVLVVGLSLTVQAQRTATATATLSNEMVVAIAVTDGGSGYWEAPIVTLFGGGGTGATAAAAITNGAVSSIAVMTPGSGWSSPPEVVISAPPAQPALLDLQMVPLVRIYGLAGDTNEIQIATTLSNGPVWIPLTNVVLTGSVLEWYDRISLPGTKGFYRAVLVGAGSFPTPGLNFVWLPPGQFTMGSPDDEQDRRANEGPQTRVTLTRGFFMARCEVTQGEHLAVAGNNPSAFLGDPTRPVEQVTWHEATNYCAKLTQQERAAGRLLAGWAYRLPTEAEWEYACRAGTTNRFYYGDDPNYTRLANYAWYSESSSGTTHPVGRKLPNRWGLYDMHGNVWGWCLDWFSGSLPGGNVTDPQGPASGTYRVFRGGSWWFHPASYCRSAISAPCDPAGMTFSLGFRVVLAPVQP